MGNPLSIGTQAAVHRSPASQAPRPRTRRRPGWHRDPSNEPAYSSPVSKTRYRADGRKLQKREAADDPTHILQGARP
jgi:hypothetical protein